MRFEPDQDQQSAVSSRIKSPLLTFQQDQKSFTMGWYVQAVDEDPRNETGLGSPRKIGPEGALLIARAFDQALSASTGRPIDSFEVGVRQQNDHARDLIRQAAAEAEKRAEALTIQLTAEARRRADELAAWDQAAPARPAFADRSDNGSQRAFAGS